MLKKIILSGVLCAAFASQGAERAYRHGMTMTKPSERWQDALPAGNGQVGALVYGSVNAERILFNHNKLWIGGRIDDVPDMSGDLDVVRKLMLEGKYVEANGHYSAKIKQAGFKGSNARYHPAFDLLITTDPEMMSEDYVRTVNFETGEIEVMWSNDDTRFSRKLFVSIPDEVSVMSITASQSGKVNGRVTLDIHDLKDSVDRKGKISKPGFTYKTLVDGDFIEFRADGSDGGEFGGVLRVLNKNGKADASDGAIHFSGADEVVLMVGFFANEPSDTAVPRLKKQLGALSGSYVELFNRHATMHRAKFNAMELTLNRKRDTPNEQLLLDVSKNPASTELVQKLFDYGRYLLVSGSRGGSIPMGLQGIWNGDYYPAWDGLYGINENLQMAYWQALPGNMDDSMMAFYDYFDARLDEFRYNAKQLWGCRGIYIPPFMSPESGRLRHTAPHVIHWTDAAGWLASFYYDYYLFTGDKEFLRSRAIPFMKEVALFYEDYIVKGEDGKNMIFPSQSPENVASNMMRDRVKVQMNSTVAFAISKEVFNNLVEACELLDVEQEGVKRWKKQLTDMPDYQVNKDGAICEWMHPDFEDNYEHRHQSHVYPVFPGTEVTEESNPEIYEACRVAIEKRLVIGLQSQTGWSMAHMANVYARLGDGKRAMDALNILLGNFVGENLFTYHDGLRGLGVKTRTIAPFQIDANCGIPAAVMEMLCGSTSDMLRILPALPATWTTGEFNNMLTRTGTRTSASWDMEKKTIELTLNAMRETAFDLKFPAEVVELTSTKPKAVSDSKYGNRYRSVKLAKGDELKLNIRLK